MHVSAQVRAHWHIFFVSTYMIDTSHLRHFRTSNLWQKSNVLASNTKLRLSSPRKKSAPFGNILPRFTSEREIFRTIYPKLWSLPLFQQTLLYSIDLNPICSLFPCFVIRTLVSVRPQKTISSIFLLLHIRYDSYKNE